MKPLISYDQWLQEQPGVMTRDAIWRMKSYKLGMYSQVPGWADAQLLASHSLTRPIASQLYRALGSIPANIAEGFSRNSFRDRIQLYESALGSSREGVVWYRWAEPILGSQIIGERFEHLAEIERLLLATIVAERRNGR